MRRIWVTAGVGVTVVFVVWSLIAYRASTVARRGAESGDRIAVTHTGGVWTFSSRSASDSAATFVFFPGSLVDPRAYAPLARTVAQAGYPTSIVELPRRGAFGGADSEKLALRIRSTLAARSGQPIVVGGHSKGGVVASRVVADFGASLDGLVLVGTSHPRDVDLSGVSMPVTKIVGTRDGIANPDRVRANAHLLPAHTTWIWIEGGNHSQFGWYGFQPMDGRARVSAAEQREIMVRAVLELLEDVSTSEGGGR